MDEVTPVEEAVEIPEIDATILDDLMLGLLSVDDEVEIVDAAVDHNAPHGTNTFEEMEV